MIKREMVLSISQKKVCVALGIFLIIVSLSANCFAQGSNEWTGNANVILGFKDLSEDDWEPLDEHTEFGFDMDLMNRAWPVSLNVGYLRSFAEDDFLGSDWEGMTSEWYVGAKKIFKDIPMIRPFVNGGFTISHGEIEEKIDFTKSNSSEDNGFGIYFGGGIYFTFIEQINVGFNLRYSYSEVTLFRKDFNAGGLHYGVMCGYHF